MKTVLNFIDIPQEVQVLILQLCKGEDLLNFAEAFQNKEIDNLIKHKILWNTPTIGPRNLRKYLKYLGPYTKDITIIGPVILNKSSKPSKNMYDKSEFLPESVLSSIRLNCPSLESLRLQNCMFDTEKIKFSQFPKSLKSLSLINVELHNKSQQKFSVSSSPFFGIKKMLPNLERLELENPWWLKAWDSTAIISGCKQPPSLEIQGLVHVFTFVGESSTLSRDSRRSTSRQFLSLLESNNGK